MTVRSTALQCLLLATLWLASARPCGAQRPATAAPAPRSIPVIYCTDLFHPFDDPDDHFDLATIFNMRELDLRAVVLDQGDRQKLKPGSVPVAQMNRLTGQHVPAAIGLAQKLRSPADKALDQPAEFQRGVGLILDVLRATTTPLMLATVGSLRDVAAAFNREPELFRAKVGKLLIFIGEASGPQSKDYNVSVDPQAFVCIMRSGLPVYWVPCFDGGLWQNKGHASFWRARHEDLLRDAAPGLLQFFIYAMLMKRGEELAFLEQPVDPVRQKQLFDGVRPLWCTAVFNVLADKVVAREGTRYTTVSLSPAARPADTRPLFDFADVEIFMTDNALVRYGHRPGSTRIKRFEIRDQEHYAEGMTALTARMLRQRVSASTLK